MGCLDNVYTSSYTPKLLSRLVGVPSHLLLFDSATQTSPPTHRDNVYASCYSPKPLLPPGLASSYAPRPQCKEFATQSSPPTHRKLAKSKQYRVPALHPASITAAQVIQQPSDCSRMALADWTMSADERALRALTAGFIPRPFRVADGVPCLGTGKAPAKVSASPKAKSHDAQEMDFWMNERSRCKAVARAAMVAGCVLQKPRSRRWAAARAEEEEEEEEELDCERSGETDRGETSDEETVDGEAFVSVGSSIVEAFQNGSGVPRAAERTHPLVAMVVAGFDALRGRGSG